MENACCFAVAESNFTARASRDRVHRKSGSSTGSPAHSDPSWRIPLSLDPHCGCPTGKDSITYLTAVAPPISGRKPALQTNPCKSPASKMMVQSHRIYPQMAARSSSVAEPMCSVCGQTRILLLNPLFTGHASHCRMGPRSFHESIEHRTRMSPRISNKSSSPLPETFGVVTETQLASS